MAIRDRKRNGARWCVYWRDPETGKQKSKHFYTQKDAFLFDLMCKKGLAEIRDKFPKQKAASRKNEDGHVFPEKIIVPHADNNLERIRQKCLKLYQDPSNRIADIFDYIMEEMRLPIRFKEVMLTAKNAKRENVSAKLRALVLARDNYRCRMCGATAAEERLHVDHIVPVARGGMTEERNLQTLCEKCNLGKRDFPL